VERLPRLGCQAECQRGEVSLIGCLAVKARVGPPTVVQQGLRTPTGTVFRELLYRWHPWFGMRVASHGAVDKADGVVFRCTLSGSATDRWLEVPAWMFDRARCLDSPRLTASPFVSMDALSVLSDLLQQALKRPLSSSNAPHSGASRSSHDQNRGEAHDHAKPDTTASDADRTALPPSILSRSVYWRRTSRPSGPHRRPMRG
jgi:hypothetical protein